MGVTVEVDGRCLCTPETADSIVASSRKRTLRETYVAAVKTIRVISGLHAVCAWSGGVWNVLSGRGKQDNIPKIHRVCSPCSHTFNNNIVLIWENGGKRSMFLPWKPLIKIKRLLRWKIKFSRHYKAFRLLIQDLWMEGPSGVNGEFRFSISLLLVTQCTIFWYVTQLLGRWSKSIITR